jgi:hypothetical protein
VPNPLIGLESGRASVQPGGQARLAFTITNTGTRVEGYNLTVVGPTAPWARIEPAQLSVYPQEPASAAVVFSPPPGTGVLGGVHPFAVFARSTLDPTSTAVAEGDVEVAKVPGLQARIVPATSSGRWRGQHVVHVANRGNTVAQLQMVASDPDEAIGFYVSPSTVTLPPGGQATVRLSALGRHPFLRGPTQRLAFEVAGEPVGRPPDAARPPGPGFGDPSRPVVAGAFNQKPILTGGLIAVLVGVLAAVLALAFYLQTRPERPEAELAARDAPQRPVVTVTDVGPTSVRLRWDRVESADGYQVQQVDRPGGDAVKEYPPLGEVNVFEPPDLPSAAQACFQVRALRGATRGPLSETVCARTAPAAAPPMTSMPVTATPLPERELLPALVATPAPQIVIDGDTSDWTLQLVSRAAAPITLGTTTTTGDIYLRWDADALYVLAKVTDASVNAVNPADLARVYKGDAVVLELGPDNSGLTKEGVARPNDAYYMFGVAPILEGPQPTLPPNPADTVVIGRLGPRADGSSFDEPLSVDPNILAAARRTGQGYDLEARIPWASTGLSVGGAGTRLAANVVVSDRDPNSYANLAMVSTNQQRTVGLRAHPYYWQSLELRS